MRSKTGKAKLAVLVVILVLMIAVLPMGTKAFEPLRVERPHANETAIAGSFIVYIDPNSDRAPLKNFVMNKGGMVAYDYEILPAIGV
jgi:hypothetical protein